MIINQRRQLYYISARNLPNRFEPPNRRRHYGPPTMMMDDDDQRGRRRYRNDDVAAVTDDVAAAAAAAAAATVCRTVDADPAAADVARDQPNQRPNRPFVAAAAAAADEPTNPSANDEPTHVAEFTESAN